jgi:hypothetical protein
MKSFKQLILESTKNLTLTYKITGSPKSHHIGKANSLEEIDDMKIDFLSKMDQREKRVKEFFVVTLYTKAGPAIVDKNEYKYNIHLDINNSYEKEDVLKKATQKFPSLSDVSNKKFAEKILKKAFSKKDFLKAKQIIDKTKSSEYSYVVNALQLTMDDILIKFK